MNHHPKKPTKRATVSDADKIKASAAEIRAQLESLERDSTQTSAAADSQYFRLDEPVVVSGKVSTYMESDQGRGSFAVQLAVENATITTTVTMEFCSVLSLRCTAFKAAEQMLGDLLAQTRLCMQINETFYLPEDERSEPDLTNPKHSPVERDSFWVVQARTDGAPDFKAQDSLVDGALKGSAALAEFACQAVF